MLCKTRVDWRPKDGFLNCYLFCVREAYPSLCSNTPVDICSLKGTMWKRKPVIKGPYIDFGTDNPKPCLYKNISCAKVDLDFRRLERWWLSGEECLLISLCFIITCNKFPPKQSTQFRVRKICFIWILNFRDFFLILIEFDLRICETFTQFF